MSQKGKLIEFKLKLQLLATTGNKAVKTKRLYDGWRIRSFNSKEEAAAANANAPKKKKVINALKTFPSTAKWQSLVPNAIAVNEPENPTFNKPRSPTVPVGDAQFIQKKYKFNEIFDIQSFAGKRDSYEQD